MNDKSNKLINTSVTLDKKTFDFLNKIKTETGKTKSYLVRSAVSLLREKMANEKNH